MLCLTPIPQEKAPNSTNADANRYKIPTLLHEIARLAMRAAVERPLPKPFPDRLATDRAKPFPFLVEAAELDCLD